IAIEAFDDRLFELVKASNLDQSGLGAFPKGGGWLIVETGADSQDDARAQAETIAKECAGAKGSSVLTDRNTQKKVWTVREAGLGVTAHPRGKPSAWPGWEDSAVPPEALGEYLRAFRGLLDRYDYHCSFYGHFGDGVVHCRIDFELASEEGLARYQAFAEEAA